MRLGDIKFYQHSACHKFGLFQNQLISPVELREDKSERKCALRLIRLFHYLALVCLFQQMIYRTRQLHIDQELFRVDKIRISTIS